LLCVIITIEFLNEYSIQTVFIKAFALFPNEIKPKKIQNALRIKVNVFFSFCRVKIKDQRVRILWTNKDKKIKLLGKFFSLLSEEKKKRIQAVAMEMAGGPAEAQ